MDLIGLTAMQAARLIRDGKLNAIDLTKACLDRIGRRDAAVEAFAFSDADAVRISARLCRPGPLQGIPVGVKDLPDTTNMPSDYGLPIRKGWRPKADAAAVARARAAGPRGHRKTVTAVLLS